MKRRWRKKRTDGPSPDQLIPPEGVPLNLKVAGVGVRMGAQLADILITGVAWIAVLIFIGMLEIVSPETFAAFAILSFFFIRIPYYALSELAWNGQTLGKRFASIKVVANNGGSLTPHSLVARNLMKEAEVFLPGTLIFSLSTTEPVQSLIAAAWIAATLAVPLMNPRRRRLGDMIAGTYVVHLPVPVLFKDMAQSEPASEDTFVFLAHQLDHYGAFELQTLEDLLRAQSRAPTTATDAKNRDATIATIVAKIRAKIEYAEAISPKDNLNFLQAFYNAQRAHLEQRQLFGDRRADKHHSSQGNRQD